ncbi:MAG TPA: MBG domain-containing protein, partial [Rhizomicrobium sp.]|nr:MBG domain-containing protein [Rhizomicrobium sp.]
AGQGISSNGQLTLDASGDIQLVSGTGLNAPIISLTGHGGSIGFSGFSIPVNAPSGALQLSVSNLGANGSAYLTSNSPVSVVAGGLSGGSFDLRAAGDITVNSLIATSGASTLIALFSDGSLTFNASVTNTGGSIFLSANSQFASGSPASITGGGTLSAANIAIQLGGVNATGTGSIGTSSSPLQLNTSGLEVSSAGQNVFLNSQGPVTISTVDGTLGITGVDLSDGIGGFGDFSLSAAGQLTQTNPITANNITLATSGAGSSVVLGDNIAAGALTVQSAADITISANTTLTSSARGTAVLLGAVGNFINNSGAGAVNLAGGGRFLIYSADPARDVFGNLDSQNTAIFSTGYPTGIQAPGNRYVFALTPTLTVSANSVSKAYGVDTSASLPNGYTISGIQPGVVGAYLADSAASYSGTPVLTRTGAAANATVGSYAIAVSVGSFAATGYAIAFQNGTLTVTPQTLTYTANAHARLYGAANPAFSGTVSGFVNGDTLATATSGTPVFGTTATAASSVGSYAINGSGLIAANYIFAQAAGNAAALTINPAILAYVANTATRIYGAANPAFSGNVSGFVNGDTLASATSGALVFAANATAASAVGSYAINGVGLIAANYIFTQAAGNAAALTITPATLLYVANAATRTVGAADPAFGGAVNGFLNADTLSSATSGR